MKRALTSPCEGLAERYQGLLEVTQAIAAQRDLDELCRDLARYLPHVVQVNFAALSLHDPAKNTMRLQTIQANVPADLIGGHEGPVDDSPAGLVWQTQQALLVPDLSQECRWPHVVRCMREDGAQSFCIVPLTTVRRRLGAMGFLSLEKEAYSEADIEFLQLVAKQVAVAVENVLAFKEIAELKDKLAKEKLYLEDEIRLDYNFEKIVGESPALKRVLKQVEIVAPTDSTVLILGETGTGKELIARAIHNLSGRRERTFVKLNCAAIPSGLLESELFGHERGAFTGAITQKIGRFELADGGTLFLDEVGDIPLDLQSKLLRVLQEQEFERLGSTKTTKVNVRLLAATNRDLATMVAEKQFRSDLYYRLNVFPVTLPPLRDRREDIPLLVRYFAQKLARRMDKRIETIPAETMAALSAYSWPGNIRELENLIERAVILSQGPDLYVPLAELTAAASQPVSQPTTLEEAERDHIRRVLEAADWVIGGPAGAAARLGMKRTTLQSKMKKLGISRPS
ncbi:Formate hydrogenlyase transcriptional activator (fragment) [Candidatus Nitrospira inopinata]|uniref:Formate hydrogenlyase transcriptional activator n=2 Tax=Candidatus Nitrospira inopinata TaxID=1715989 RepID=A0A0S4KP93_9BACT